MPKQFDCCEMFICCCEMLNKNLSIPPSPASVLPGIVFSACVPSRLTGLPPCQTAQRGTAPFAGTGTDTGQLYWQRISYFLVRIGKEMLCSYRAGCFVRCKAGWFRFALHFSPWSICMALWISINKRSSKYISFHGISINFAYNLEGAYSISGTV